VILLVAAIWLVRVRRNAGENPEPRSRTSRNAEQKRNSGFDRRVSFLEYTKHARCRMDCRKITQTEVEDIMRNGRINYRKSNANGHPCPVYAVEGRTDDDQRVRIVFAQCNEETRVITCIDLEKEWQCDCPGDDDKYKNQGSRP
jgi:hypothetical protein